MPTRNGPCGIGVHDSANSRVYWVSCCMPARSARRAALADVIERCGSARARGRDHHRLERGKHALALRLAERDEPHAGGDQIGRERMQHALHARAQAQCRDPHTRRPPRRAVRSLVATSSRSSACEGQAARVTSRKARPCAVVSRCRSFEGAKATASSATLRSAPSSLLGSGAIGVGEKNGVAESAAFLDHDREPLRSVFASVTSPDSTAHSMPLE